MHWSIQFELPCSPTQIPRYRMSGNPWLLLLKISTVFAAYVEPRMCLFENAKVADICSVRTVKTQPVHVKSAQMRTREHSEQMKISEPNNAQFMRSKCTIASVVAVDRSDRWRSMIYLWQALPRQLSVEVEDEDIIALDIFSPIFKQLIWSLFEIKSKI